MTKVKSLSKTERAELKKEVEEKLYRYYGINTAMDLLRPGARWEVHNDKFTIWEDPRPCPTWDEINETLEKIKAFEDTINTIWLPEQLEQYNKQTEIVADKYDEILGKM